MDLEIVANTKEIQKSKWVIYKAFPKLYEFNYYYMYMIEECTPQLI